MKMEDIPQKRSRLLSAVTPALQCVRTYYSNDVGSGLMKKVQRLFRYGSKYIRYSLARAGLLPSQKVSVKTFWGKPITLSLLDACDVSVLYCGIGSGEEHKLTKFLIKHLKEDEVFYDVGAHVGLYSLLASEIVSRGEIHAFEPAPRTFFCLKQSVADIGGTVFCNNFALGKTDGVIPFFDKAPSPGDNSGSSTTVLELGETLADREYRKIEVPVKTLTSYFKNHSTPTFLKIDVEGAEADVLSGGESFFALSSPTIVIEVWGGERGGKFSARAVRILERLGYRPHAITEEGDLKLLDNFDPERDVKEKWDNIAFRKL